MNFMRDAWVILRMAVLRYAAGRGFTYAAAIAFYTMLSMAPLLIITVQAATLFAASDAIIQEFVQQAGSLLGPESAESIEEILTSTSAEVRTNSWAGVLSAVLSLIGATTVLVQLQQALNETWGVQPTAESGVVLRVVWKRIVSLALLSAVAFILMVSLVVDAALASVRHWVDEIIVGAAIPVPVMEALNHGISLALFAAIFALVFQLLPDVRLSFRDVAFGAVVTAVLFWVGKALIGLYIGTAAVGSAYGAAGSLAALLTWIYYASALVLLGAEITRARAVHLGSTIKAARDHELTDTNEPAKQIAEAV